MHACVHAHIQTKLGIRSLRPQCEPSVGNQSECAPRLGFPGLFVPPSLLPPLSLVLSLARAFARSRACSLSISLSLMRALSLLLSLPFALSGKSLRFCPSFLYCYVCVLILLCMCPHTAIYVSSHCYVCVFTQQYIRVFILLCVLIPHTANVYLTLSAPLLSC